MPRNWVVSLERNEVVTIKRNRVVSISGFSTESKNVILSPITLKSKSGQEKIFYIIYLQTTKDRYKAYLWNYFPQVELKKEEYANSYVQKQISTLTKWDYSFETLEDELFWNQYVLLKENNNYKYLIEL
jgi:hypothetical protein